MGAAVREAGRRGLALGFAVRLGMGSAVHFRIRELVLCSRVILANWFSGSGR